MSDCGFPCKFPSKNVYVIYFRFEYVLDDTDQNGVMTESKRFDKKKNTLDICIIGIMVLRFSDTSTSNRLF